MSMLPKQFADLERFAEDGWALPREHDRWKKRVTSSTAVIKDFYETLLPRMDDVMTYLDRNLLADVPEGDRPLLYLALAFMDVAPTWEVFQAADLPEPVYEIDRMHIYERRYPWESGSAMK